MKYTYIVVFQNKEYGVETDSRLSLVDKRIVADSVINGDWPNYLPIQGITKIIEQEPISN